MIRSRSHIAASVLALTPYLVAPRAHAAEPDSAAANVRMAQAQPTEEEKKKREREHKAAPAPAPGQPQPHAQPQPRTQPQPSGPPKAAAPSQPAPKSAAPVTSAPPKAAIKTPPVVQPSRAVITAPVVIPPKAATPAAAAHDDPARHKGPVAPGSQTGTASPPPPPPAGGTQQAVPRQTAPLQTAPQQQPAVETKAAPPRAPSAVPAVAAGAAVGIAAGVAAAAASHQVKPGLAPAPQFDAVQKGRQQHVEDGGKRTVIQEPGNRIIIKQDNRIIIRHDDSERFLRLRDAQSARRPDGIVETFYVRPDGFRVVTEVDADGRMLRRYRRGPDGREFSIVDNRQFWRNAGIGVGVGALALAIALNLPPLRVDIPRERYIVDYDRASDDDLYEALSAPPVDQLDRAYALEEVRYNRDLRERMRRIDLDAITFDFGASDVLREQYPRLERLARSMRRLIDRNQDEVFLVEGHTDAVGSEIDNLSLSDRRASAVAQVLTEQFGIPPENLVTQGYGEQFLKVQTQAAERLNRRVAIRRITPLMAQR